MSKSGLQNQIYLYSLETKDFYTEDEYKINERYFKNLRIKKKIKEKRKKYEEFLNFYEKKLSDGELLSEEDVILQQEYEIKFETYDSYLNRINILVNKSKKELNEKINQFAGVRVLRDDSFRTNKVIGLFESTLTRVCKFKNDEITDKLFVIRIFHYQILESIIHNGFIFNGEEYEYFTSSAGQIRTKKIVCIKSSTYEKYHNTITCGLSVDDINNKGGVNTNKYQAYLALANSASMKWNRFNIDRIVVVDDFSTKIHTEVDYINRDTYEITRQEMPIPIDHMDGCGIMLPTVSKKPFMFRLPWMKGLVAPIDYRKFIELNGGRTKIIDIYGKEYDVIEDKINIILTKSQFKMWKFYDSWDEYKEKFKKYNCEASKLNIEDIGSEASINYQMLQTLVSMTNDELKTIAQNTVTDILQLGKDKKTMLRVLGATKENSHKNYFQKALMLYPELLSDSHSREVIKNKKRRLVRDAKAGKLRVNGYYTFIIPDIYAFCEWLFLGESNPKGLLKHDEVYCNIFEEGEVDILRAPHLYKEHAIRKNTLDTDISEWFITKGVYTSVHDPISRILQFDNDGDKGLVVQDETLISVAKREMEGVVPLYYEMAKAKDAPLTSDLMYTALTSAYKANIGIISNDITKIWNSENPNVDAVKWLCMYNNFVIDYAKTLFLPSPPKAVEDEIKKFTKNKLPHFFIYAKDKADDQVSKGNDSTVNKLDILIPNNPIRFKAIAGDFDYRNLMNNKRVISNQEVINTYIINNRNKHNIIKDSESVNDDNFNEFLKEELSKFSTNPSYITDVLVNYLYSIDSKYKETLWHIYGDIIYHNLHNNIGHTVQCECCNIRTDKSSEKMIYCNECARKINIKKTIDNRKNKKIV